MIPPVNQEPVYEKVSGIIERITFHNQENGYSIIKVSPFDNPRNLVTVEVHQAQVVAGDSMEFHGAWISHPKFGKQFKAQKAISKKPASAHAMEKYLGSGLIHGVGPKTAQKIVKYFGKDTLSVFDGDIDRLMEVPSIGKQKLLQIKKDWEEHKAIKDVMIFLQSHGISTLYSVKIYKEYGNDAIAVVTGNPYRLAKDIYGIGFFSADRIARSLGFAEDSPERIAAGIKHILDSSRENGHCYLTGEQMYNGVLELLSLNNASLIEDPLQKLIEDREISTRLMENEDTYYYANSLYWDEINLSRRLKEILKKQHKVDQERIRQWVNSYCEKIGMKLSQEQFETVISVSSEPFSIITGGPGCGKTTTTKVIVKLFEAMKKNILLAAPTGRASQRMTEVIGRDAITIHRLLVFNPREGKFDRNEENPLTVDVKEQGKIVKKPVDVLIIDETSMLDISLASSLFKAIPVDCQVIFIGDADQLPSVGAGNVLHDLLSCKHIRHFALTKIFRQAQESYIITHAHEINSGIVPQIATPVKDNSLFKSKIDCLFIDSEEATQEQLRFIKRAKYAISDVEAGGSVKVFMKDDVKNVIEKTEDGELNIYQTVRDIEVPYEDFVIPRKLFNADLKRLAESRTGAEELLSVMKQIPRYSTLHYGMTASQSVVRLVSETLPKFFGKDIEIQVLAPMVRGSIGTVMLNKEIQEKVNPFREGQSQIAIGDRKFREGDRVIQGVNNYNLKVFSHLFELHNPNSKPTDMGIFNGEIGTIIEVKTGPEPYFVIEFGAGDQRKFVKYEKSDITEISLAYAITIHKSQGSEFPIVVIPLLTQHFNMLFRNLIYTGLTRARKLAVFVGSRKALAMAVQKLDTKERQTTLGYLLDSML